MENLSNAEKIAQAMKEERKILEGSKTLEESNDDEKELLLSLLKEGLL
ncbi:MAG: hypothetical protein ACTSR8_14795 [Promethearchaeota archaeon]